MSGLEIIYQDSDLIVVNKPADISVHKTDIDKTSDLNVMTTLRDQIGQWVYPVHRLDRPTSGVLLFGLSSQIAGKLVKQFSERTVRKNYLAVVRGYTPLEETIDYPLKPKSLKRHLASQVDEIAQSAVTSYKRLDKIEINYPVGRYDTARYALLDVSPHTGRHRQIRRHLKHIFHPIIGDTSFGDGTHNKFFRENLNCHRLLLHAYRLQIYHPADLEKRLIFEAKLDQEFQDILDQFSWRY